MKRQVYQGGTYVENYVHKLLKVYHITYYTCIHASMPDELIFLLSLTVLSIKVLCSSMKRKKEVPTMKQTVNDIVALFSTSLELFAHCHNVYDKKMITEEDIQNLGTHTHMASCYCKPAILFYTQRNVYLSFCHITGYHSPMQVSYQRFIY